MVVAGIIDRAVTPREQEQFLRRRTANPIRIRTRVAEEFIDITPRDEV
jgi:hypothetical protein